MNNYTETLMEYAVTEHELKCEMLRAQKRQANVIAVCTILAALLAVYGFIAPFLPFVS